MQRELKIASSKRLIPVSTVHFLIIHSSVRDDDEKPTADNSLHLDIVGIDVSYTATIQIGSPPRDFNILMDSGSGDFWVGSEACLSEDDVENGCASILRLVIFIPILTPEFTGEPRISRRAEFGIVPRH
jgi:hypothetical protein